VRSHCSNGCTNSPQCYVTRTLLSVRNCSTRYMQLAVVFERLKCCTRLYYRACFKYGIFCAKCVCVCFFIINFISQHVPLQKAILHARDCLYVYVICVICFCIYTTDCLLWNTDLVLLYAYSRLKCRPILCVLQSVKVYRVYKHLEPFCVIVG